MNFAIYDQKFSLQLVLCFKVLPQINPFTFGDDEMNLDDAVSAVCTITKGDLPIRIWWTLLDDFNGVERNLSTNDGLMITRTSQKLSVLNIDAVKGRHRGNYTCHAQNKAGTSKHSAFLFINGELNLIFKAFPFVF